MSMSRFGGRCPPYFIRRFVMDGMVLTEAEELALVAGEGVILWI